MTVRTYTKLHLIVYLAIFTVCIVTLKAILHKSTSEPRRRNESPNLEIEISDFRVEEQSVDFEEQTEVSLIDTGFVKELPFYRARLDRRRLVSYFFLLNISIQEGLENIGLKYFRDEIADKNLWLGLDWWKMGRITQFFLDMSFYSSNQNKQYNN